jgi:signal transduction histidine kinase
LRDGDLIRLGSVEMSFRISSTKRDSAGLPDNGWVPTLPGREGHSGVSAGTTVLQGIVRIDSGVARVAAVSSVVSPSSGPKATEDPRMLARKLQASYQISKATAGTLDLSRVLDQVLAALFEIFETAERSFILLVDSKTGEVSAATVKRRVPADTGEIAISRTAVDQAMKNREVVLCRDAMTDARYAQAQSVINLRIRSMMIAPLVFQDQMLGAIYVDTRSAAGQFAQSDLELLSVAASQGAACVANVRLHEELVTSARLAAVGQTVAGLTHCVKNILQGIQGGSFMLDKSLAEGKLEGAKAGWEMVKRNNGFMEEMVFDLLSYSKERTPEYESADLNALCRDVHGLASDRAQAKGVSVTFNPDPVLGPVEIDPKGIRRCLLNLVMNAVDACAAKGGTVAVEARHAGEDGLVRVFVRDTGCGMSEQTKARLFAVFFSTKGSKGTGLGLPVSKKIVEEHGGRIEVESQQDKGTTFTICLPPKRRQEIPERSAT